MVDQETADESNGTKCAALKKLAIASLNINAFIITWYVVLAVTRLRVDVARDDPYHDCLLKKRSST